MERFKFSKLNLILLVLAAVLLVVGYGILNTGDRTISPVILIITYLLIIPFAFLYHKK
ncbi:MAG TPA: hypothetical protein PKJ08_03435 [Candidatus Cloacimonadota bacterium]|nr:hypothetical protein [Candidatus Cloacimonadota bacterium]HOD53561.1 hypothetical protein [Candidatus Cloacimonadota bacterium]HPM01889.1 hypothetical protein [Candidatus Cloacimonadota bacterium]